MNGAHLGKKLWIFVCLVLFIGGCAESSRSDAKSPNEQRAGAAQANYPQVHAESKGGFFGGSDRANEPSPDVSSTPAQAGQPGPSGGSQPQMAPPSPSPAPQSAPRTSSRSPSPPPPAPALAPPPAKSTPSGGGRASVAESAPAPRAPAATTQAPEPKPTTRPGLGTEFGEARASRTHEVTFVRDTSRPFAVAALNYNDRKGVDALASAQANKTTSRSVSSGGGAVTISIRGADANPLEAVHVGDRTFVVGQAGQRYTIVLENHTSHRFEALGTVDGLDVINGKPGTFDNRGYILMPFATLEIEGFRTSTSAVAAFRFAAVADSYAAQTGSARNVGVIGLAFFLERGDSFIPENETRMRDTASPFPADPRFAQPPQR